MEAFLLVFLMLLLLIQVGNIAYLRRRLPSPCGRRPFVSILIPARNEAVNLRGLLPSILAQRYERFEVIVYDDESGDETWQVLQNVEDERLRPIHGSGPPEGWIGKVHALYQASRAARGEVFVFLDADARLKADDALGRLVDRFEALGANRVLTGFTELRGRGLLLVSLVPHTILSFLPWFMTERLPYASLGVVNGQCWIVDAAVYERLSPHQQVKADVLEDVNIGRYLKKCGIQPVLIDVRPEVTVYMYENFGDAWLGFRKNGYLLMGGSVRTFIPLFAAYTFAFAIAPFLWPEVLAAVWFLKLLSDRAAGMPIGVSLAGPLAHVAGVLLQLDSAVSHWCGAVTWKGRQVGRG